MDPLTMTFLFCIVAAAYLRNTYEDVRAQHRGDESPRIARRRARQDLDQQRADATGHPSIGQAVSGRVADRIANPPENSIVRSLRDYFAERVADALSDALDDHRARRAARGQPDDDLVQLVARYCPRGCGRMVTFDGPCGVCRLSDHQPDPAAEPDDEIPDAEVVDDPPAPDQPEPDSAPDQEPSPRCTGCGRVLPGDGVCAYPSCAPATDPPPADEPPDQEPQPQPAPDAAPNPDPEPNPGPDNTTNPEGTPMPEPTDTTVIDGDTRDPYSARARAQQCVNTAGQVAQQVEVCANNAEADGVGPAAVGEIRGLMDDIAVYVGAGESAVAVFDQHAATVAEIGADADLRNTTDDTYLDTANA